MVCLGLGVAVVLTLLLSSVRQLLLIQAEDMMYELVLLARLDHPTPRKTDTINLEKIIICIFHLATCKIYV